MIFIYIEIKKFLILINIVIILPCALIYMSFTKVPKCIKESKNFKENYIQVEATVLDYETRSVIKRFNHKTRTEYSYAPICLYVDDTGKEYLLRTDTFLYSRPKKGATKEIYINPSNPEKYYDDLSEISIPIIILPVLTLLSVSYSYLTIKDFLALY